MFLSANTAAGSANKLLFADAAAAEAGAPGDDAADMALLSLIQLEH